MRIVLHYKWRIFCINLEMNYKMVRVHIAGALLKLVKKISPDLMREYDRTVREYGRVRF